MRLSHNMFSLGIYRNYKTNLTDNSKAIGNISSGKKLNSAKDNPNKIAQSENLKIQLLAREAAVQNTQDTNSMIQTFDGALQEVNNNLSRLKELTVKAANGSYDDADKDIIQKEIDSIKEGIDHLVTKTTFNNIPISKGTGLTDINVPSENKKSQIGALPDEAIDVPFYNVTSEGLGIKDIDVTIAGDPQKAISDVDKAVNLVSRIRSKYGAIQNRLENNISTMEETNESYSRAQSSIEDADVAEEMVEFCRSQIVTQSSIALMAQSNKFPQEALNVLSNVR